MKPLSILFAAAAALAALGCQPGPATPHAQWDWASASSTRPEGTADGVWTGFFNEAAPLDLAGVQNLETQIGKKFASILWFQDYSTGFATDRATAAWNAGYLPHVTWEPWFFGDQKRIRLADILDGTWDAYITQWGRDAAAFGKPVLVRWGHEFNGNWYPWSVATNGESAETYVAAYRHVHDLVVKAGAHNILWAWCPNSESVPAAAWNRPTLAYPGDDYVDWIGMDGYDFDGNDTFVSKFSRLYTELVSTYDKPLFIGEMSTGRKGADRAQWLQDLSDALKTTFPAIKGLVWFNINKERDWRLEESPESLAKAIEVFSQPLFQSRPDAVPRLAEVYHQGRPGYIEAAQKANAVTRDLVEVRRRSPGVGGILHWTDLPRLAITDKSGLEGSLQLAWDDQALYLRVEAQDATPLKNPQKADGIWNGDNLEVCLSTDPAADPNRGFFTATDWQFGFSTGDPSASVPAQTWEWAQLKGPIPGAQVRATAVAGGYRLEASLPWAALGSFVPQVGLVIGADFAVDNGGDKGTRVGQWVWNGASSFYNNPAQWGSLRFVD